MALGLSSKLFESTSEELYSSRREVFVVVVEGLGLQYSDPLGVFRFIGPDLFFWSAGLCCHWCVTKTPKVAFTTFMSKFLLEKLSTKKMIFHREKFRNGI